MSQTFSIAISVVGIDIGKNSFHVVGLDERGAIMLRQKWSRGQVEARFANMPSCLVGMEACVGANEARACWQPLSISVIPHEYICSRLGAWLALICFSGRDALMMKD